MVSLVIPIYNEEESITAFFTELIKNITSLGTVEILFVDDGSTDRSLSILKELEKKDKRIRVFAFRQNQGKAEALTLGFQKATGDYIVTLDADLQDNPSEIPHLLSKAKEGWDLVCGWRKNRNDPPMKIISSKFFNFLVRKLWGLDLHDYNCGLKAYTKEAAQSLRLYGGMHRFIPILAHNNGFRVCEVPVLHSKRKFGKSKYGFSKLWKDSPDIFTMVFLAQYSKRPFHFFGTIGGILFVSGLGILGYLSIIHFLGESIGRRPLLFLGMLLILSGFQIFFTGFLADLMINLFSKNTHESHVALRYETIK